ncbi:MAG: glycosyltransferase [Patescibacteria group bacterium]|jgi:glycosyltransferase involved in cell wall biosynthesis
MLILSNDYSNNLPNSKHHAKGGPANFAKRFKSFLKKEGHSWFGLIVEFNSTKFSKLKPVSKIKGLQYYKLEIPGVLVKKLGRTPKKIDAEKLFEPAINLIAELIKITRPDIIFLNGYAVSNWLILKAAQKEKIPVAIQHAGIWTKELRIYKDFFSLAGRKIMEGMEKEIPKIADAEIFLNDWSRRYFNVNVAKTDKNKTHIIPLPVDFRNYACVKHRKNIGQTFNIGIIARWDRIKNHKAVAALVKQVQKFKLPWKFYSVTVIPKTNKNKELKDFYRKNIVIVPPLDQKGIKKFCQQMDLLILPSHFDVSPNVVLEATGCDTPIAISENVGFVDDFKKYGANDWVINFNNANLAIKKILAIANKPMPDKLRNFLFSSHQSDKVFKDYIRLFKQLIKNK